MKHRQSADALGAGIFLVGLGVLFLLPGVGFFPWILPVIGLAGLPAALSGNRGWSAWKNLFWLAGLAVLFATGTIWPGVLVLVGLNLLLSALSSEAKQETRPADETAPELSVEPVAAPVAVKPEQEAPVAVAPPVISESDDPGTAPLSAADVAALEAELAAKVDGGANDATVPLAD